VVGALSAFYDAKDWRNKDHAWSSCVRLIAKMPTIAAMAYKTSVGQAIVYPNNNYSVAENFLYMMFSTRNKVRVVSDESSHLRRRFDKT